MSMRTPLVTFGPPPPIGEYDPAWVVHFSMTLFGTVFTVVPQREMSLAKSHKQVTNFVNPFLFLQFRIRCRHRILLFIVCPTLRLSCGPRRARFSPARRDKKRDRRR